MARIINCNNSYWIYVDRRWTKRCIGSTITYIKERDFKILGVLFIVANYGYALVESLVTAFLLFFIINYIKNFAIDNDRIKKIYRNALLISTLILFGIILVIRFILETFNFMLIVRILLNDAFLFAIMVTIFIFLHKPLIKKFGYSTELSIEEGEYSGNKFNRIMKLFTIIMWVIAGIFLLIPILRIPMNNPDRFNLGLVWAIGLLAIEVLLTNLINRTFKNENKIPKSVLKKSTITSAILSFTIWSIQLLIFELLLKKGFGIEILKQDLRVLIIVVSTLYVVFFFSALRVKFLPEVVESSVLKLNTLLQQELRRQNNTGLISAESVSQHMDTGLRFPESVSFKIYFYLNNKFGKSRTIDEMPLREGGFRGKKKIAVFTFWVITIVIFALSLILIQIFNISSRPMNVFLFSCFSALTILLIDFGITFLFNRMNPANKRVSGKILQNSIILGGIFTFWIWVPLFFLLYSYFILWIKNTLIVNILFITILSAIIFVIGMRIVKGYAKIKSWDTSIRKTLYPNLYWFAIGIFFGLFFQYRWRFIIPRWEASIYRFGDIYDIFILIIGIIGGAFIISKVYKKKLIESFKFAIVIELLLFVVTLILGIILNFLKAVMEQYHFKLLDLRFLMIISAAIYIFSFIFSFRINVLRISTAKIEKELHQVFDTENEVEYQSFSLTENHVVLDVKDLTTYFYTEEGIVRAVEGVSFKIYEGEVLGLVGETGCGKSVTALSILRLVRPPGEIKSGKVIFQGEDLHQKSEEEFLKYRGNRITMIFQDPLNSLNPVFKIGDQISEVFLRHMEDQLLIEAAKNPGKSIYTIAREWSEDLLKNLNIPVPQLIFDRYPHELSGGMRQRVQIAIGLACGPVLLIADEPTTALDVTIQNQILKLMKDLKKKYNTSILFITHDLGIISKMCDRVAVMYSGFIVEYGDIVKLFKTPRHPYSRGLISSVPVVGVKREVLDVIPGMVPNLIYPPSGCRFHPRCQYCFEPCDSEIPKSIEIEPRYFVACHLYDSKYKDLAEVSIKKAEN
ncbi:MAG: ABC transporter ATP-binding protein [Candidatus Thorarchaeota archaeon]